MPHLQAKVPQRVQDRFDDLLGPARLLVGCEERDIDIRKGCHLAPTIATDGGQRQPLGRCRVVERIEPLRREIEDQPQQLVDQECLAGSSLSPGLRMFDQPCGDLRPSGFERRLQECGRSVA